MRDSRSVTIEDRGYQFADGVYEVCEVRGGRLSTSAATWRGSSARSPSLRIAHADVGRGAGASCCARRSRRNRVRDGIVYLQVTRGVAPARPSVSGGRHAPEPGRHRAQHRSARLEQHGRARASPSSPCPTTAGSASTSNRWRCCPTCWPSRRRASRARARPGSSTRDGRVTEGASSNAWIVTRDGVLITRPLDTAFCRGITRSVVIDVLAGAGADARGARLHGRGGLCGARGLRHLGQPDRHAGGAASTAARSATARRA